MAWLLIGVYLTSCTGQGQPTSRPPNEPNQNAPTIVTQGSADGLKWTMLAERILNGECITLTNTDGQNGRSCGQMNRVPIVAERKNMARRLDDLHFDCIHFIVGAVTKDAVRLTVAANGIKGIDVPAMAVPGYSTKFFIARIPEAAGITIVRAFDAAGRNLARRDVDEKSSGSAVCA